MRFHQSFRGWSPSQKYSIRFRLNRIPFRRQHQAMNTEFGEARILFPAPSHLLEFPRNTPRIKLYNRLIESNAQQLQAVTSICFSPAGSPPFIVFGP